MNRAALLFMAILSAPAWAQDYRPDQPAVLEGAAERNRQESAQRKEALDKFSALYRQHQRPSFLMMWHRELSDSISSVNEKQATLTSVGERAADNFQRTLKVRWNDGSERTLMLGAPSGMAEFESGFHQALRKAGVALVDRNTAIRMTALGEVKRGASEEKFNFQTVEAKALAGFAKFFVEVRLVADAKGGEPAPRVTIINSESGEIIADVVASEPDRVQRYQTFAVDGRGFERRPVAMSASEKGAALAEQVMRSLAATWQ